MYKAVPGNPYGETQAERHDLREQARHHPTGGQALQYMPMASTSEQKKKEEEAKKTHVYLVTGTDSARVHARAEDLFRLLAGESPDEFSVDIISEGDESPASQMLPRVISSLREPPFMGRDNKTIWLKRFQYFSPFEKASSNNEASSSNDKKGDGTPKKPRKPRKPGAPPEIEFNEDEPDPLGVRALAKFLYKFKRPTQEGDPPTQDPRPEFPKDIYLLLEGTGCAKNSPLYAICQDLGKAEDCDPDNGDAKAKKPKHWEMEMATIIANCAAQKGVTISAEARTAMVKTLGWNLAYIDKELEKLTCYMGGDGATPISAEAVQLLCSTYEAPENWSLGDPVGARNLSRALALTEQIASVSRKPLGDARMILYALAKQFRYYMALRLCLAEMHFRNGPALMNHLESLDANGKKDLVEKYGDAVAQKPWRIKILADQCMNYTPRELLRAIQRLRDAISAINSGGASNELLVLENFLCQTLPKEGIRP